MIRYRWMGIWDGTSGHCWRTLRKKLKVELDIRKDPGVDDLGAKTIN